MCHALLTRVSRAADTRVIYPQQVPAREREIDRQEWSRVVLELLDSEAAGNRTELARRVGVDYQTVRRWIAGSHAVSEDSVRAVARTFRLSAIDLLIRVGYWSAQDVAAADSAQQAAAPTCPSRLRPSTGSCGSELCASVIGPPQRGLRGVDIGRLVPGPNPQPRVSPTSRS